MTMRASTDIDIDFIDRDVALAEIEHIPASQADGTKHNTSVYFQPIPVDPRTEIAAIDYKSSAALGYFKIDFLNNSLYQGVRDEGHLVDLAFREPEWDLFDEPTIVEGLAHIHSYFHVVQSIRPRSVTDLAVIIALIRPGKKHLVGQSRHIIDAEIWQRGAEEGYVFKKSHSFAYALSIVVQLNLMIENA